MCVLVQPEMESGGFGVANKLRASSAGIFQGIVVYSSDAGFGTVKSGTAGGPQDSRTLPASARMSPPGYPRARLRPPLAGFCFTRPV
jgi:hypothetical protein